MLDIIRFVREFRPKSILLENVPGLRRDPRFERLLDQLAGIGYFCRSFLVNAADLGVPQRRKRLIVVAVTRSLQEGLTESFVDDIRDIFGATIVTAGAALRELAGGQTAGDPLDVYRKSGKTVQDRIRAIPVNGDRFSLPMTHQLECHQRLKAVRTTGRAATASYGRVKSNMPAPTMTTRCTTPACGSFIHPNKNRGLTLREAATFQTFPFDYQFEGGYDSIERQIGNAVPVRMATLLGSAVLNLVSRG